MSPAILLKLMLALSFYETSSGDRRARRVCQSNFFLQIKSAENGKSLTAIEIQPKVEEYATHNTLTVKVSATTFRRVEPEAVGNVYIGAFYELFAYQGYLYLRQLRPQEVDSFTQPMYKKAPFADQRTTTNWYNNGTKEAPEAYKETRAYLVRHVQERLRDFLTTYGFQVTLGEELMHRLKVGNAPLPLHHLPTVQVLDNRLDKTVALSSYLAWLNVQQFKPFKASKQAFSLSFEPVAEAVLDASRPLLVLIDAGKDAFGQDGEAGLLAPPAYQDPYRELYRRLPGTVKQSLNVNPNDSKKYVVPTDYLRYTLPEATVRPTLSDPPTEEEAAKLKTWRAATKQLKNLAIKLEVCVSELWLKWVLAGKVTTLPASASLPFLADLSDQWGFVTNNCLLYFEHGAIRFADLTQPVEKSILRGRFTSWPVLKRQFMARRPEFAAADPEQATEADQAFAKAHFVLVGREAFELEATDTIAMPNLPEIKAVKVGDPAKSAKKIEALGVYAGGVWYNAPTQRYLVSSPDSSKLTEPRGHHFYQIHSADGTEVAVHLPKILNLLTVNFVRNRQFTVWPYPFDLIRLHQELIRDI